MLMVYTTHGACTSVAATSATTVTIRKVATMFAVSEMQVIEKKMIYTLCSNG